VRQLQNFVERLVVFCTGSVISDAAVQAELARPVRFVTESGVAGTDAPGEPGTDAPGEPGTGLALDEALRRAEREALVRALAHAGGNRSAAARLLGVSRSTLYAKLEEHRLLG
jgi:two-component system response regulator AtoC